MARYADLPVELLYQIADFLDSERDINAFTRTNKRSYSALNSYLYRHHVERWDAVAFKSVCMSGFSNSARMFLDQGMSLDARGDDWNPIALAAMYGHEEIVRYLLERGVDPNDIQAWELPPISYDDDYYVNYVCGGPFDLAAKNGHEGIVRLLVPHMRSADYFVRPPSRTDVYDGKTPLTLAAENGHLNLVRMLVEELNCNVEPTRSEVAGKVTWNEMTPLAGAAFGGHTDVVRYLLSVGADLNATFGLGWETPLGCAVLENHVETARALIKHGSNPDPLLRIQQAKTLFWHEANKDPYPCPCGRTQDRQLPCVLGPERKYKYFDARVGIKYPLARAAVRGNREMVKLLFQHMDLGRIREYGVKSANYFVPIAAACGLDSIVQRLLEEGCDVDAYDNLCDVRRPAWYSALPAVSGLFHSSRFGHAGTVRILLNHGADLDGGSEYNININPLMEATKAGHEQVVELLLDAGADPNAVYFSRARYSQYYLPIILFAVRSGPILRMFLNCGAASWLEPHLRLILFEEVIKSRDVSVLRALLDGQFDPSIIEIHGTFKNMIKMAAKAGPPMFEFVMQYLWDEFGLRPGPDKYNSKRERKSSQRALQSAIKCRQAEVVEIFLIRYGLQLESKLIAEYLAWAASGNDPPRSRIMLDVLLRHGADINARCRKGQTCLSLLIARKNIQGSKLVIERGAKYPLTNVGSEGNEGGDGLFLVSVAVKVACVRALELLLGLIDAQGISSEDIEPHLQQAQASIPRYYNERLRLKFIRLLEDFRWRRGS